MALPMRKTDEHFTYADYRTWPEDERWELIDGVAWNMSPAPSVRHQRMLRKLGTRIDNYLVGKECEPFYAPVDVFFAAYSGQDGNEVDTIVQPDLIVVCDPDKLESNGCKGAPDICVEILSPYTSKKDLNEKFNLYERSGVREYWILDSALDYAHIYKLGENGKYGDPQVIEKEGLLNSSVLEGLKLDLREILPD